MINKLKQLPSNSGIYQYFDKDGHLLYIGKAKNLKNRVKSYFSFTPTLQPSSRISPRIYKMISETTNLEYIVVNSEHDALILENSLIKQLKPKYNILLRDDKTYPYIFIDYSVDFPRFEITRKVIKGDVEYFGPFSTGARDLLDSIYEAVPLVQKSSCVKGGKTCLFYQIKRCLGPCENKISKEEYSNLVNQAKELINNKSKMIKILEKRMSLLAQELRYEEAGQIRDKITSIQKSNITTVIDLAKDSNLDIFAIARYEKRAVIVRFFTREGKIISSDHTFIKADDNFEISEAYKRAIVNYYNGDILIPPHSILVANSVDDIDSVQMYINSKFGKIVEIEQPKIGNKKRLIDIAFKNAQELLKQYKKYDNNILEEIKELCNLQNIPTRIEIFDNSQMMGQATVGAMVVWEDEWIKKDYRHYNLSTKDDYSQMSDMLIHRAKSFEKASPPDLWIIDGGKALLTLAKSIIESSGANVDVIAISKEKIDAKANRSKGSAKDNLYYDDNILKLSTNDKRLQFIQLLRDESHRFVIEYHRKQKRKEDKQISLLSIHGVGEGKIKKLLNYFGTFDGIKSATVKELAEVVNIKDAQNIYDFFIKSQI